MNYLLQLQHVHVALTPYIHIPASLENNPRVTPYLIASRIAIPETPPVADSKLKADSNIELNAGKIYLYLIMIIYKAKNIHYSHNRQNFFSK